MNTLFEAYVARMLKRALVDVGLRVVSQGGRLFCLETEDRRGLFQTRPDILVKRGDDVVQVIDTKWKRIATRIDDPRQGVAQVDVYQMMAYGRLYGCDRLTLLYPHHAALGVSAGVLASHRVTESDQWLATATIDIAVPRDLTQSLRALFAGVEVPIPDPIKPSV